MTRSTVYHLIDQKLITDVQYGQVPSSLTSFSASWHSRLLEALADLGVSLSEYKVGTDEAAVAEFLKDPGKDKVREAANVFPLGTFGYGYSGQTSTPSDPRVLAKEYGDSSKLFMYHFACNGREYTAQLMVTTNGSVNLTLWDKTSDKLLGFNVSSGGDNKNTKLIEDLIKAVLSLVEVGYAGKLADKKYSYDATMELLRKSGIKSSLRPSLPVSAPVLTQSDMETLLSSSYPSHVWWSPSLRQAVVRDSKGWYVVSFRYLNSSWTLDWFTMSASLVKSRGKHLVSRRASFYEDSLSALVSCQSAVMYSRGGVSRYLPFE